MMATSPKEISYSVYVLFFLFVIACFILSYLPDKDGGDDD